MKEIADAFEQYLRSLSPAEWDALTIRVRNSVPTLDAQFAADPEVIAALEAQIAAVESVIPGLVTSIESAQQSRDVYSVIAYKQELARIQTAANGLRNELETRLNNTSPLEERN